MPCLFVLISHYFNPLTEIRTNKEQIEAEIAKKLRTMRLSKIYWFLLKKACKPFFEPQNSNDRQNSDRKNYAFLKHKFSNLMSENIKRDRRP